jgi:hypothetical protein
MITTINNMCVCGPVVGDGPKRPDAIKGRPACRDPIYPEEPGREGHFSSASCPGWASGPQPRDGAEHIIIDEPVLNDPHAAGTPGGTNRGQK